MTLDSEDSTERGQAVQAGNRMHDTSMSMSATGKAKLLQHDKKWMVHSMHCLAVQSVRTILMHLLFASGFASGFAPCLGTVKACDQPKVVVRSCLWGDCSGNVSFQTSR